MGYRKLGLHYSDFKSNKEYQKSALERRKFLDQEKAKEYHRKYVNGTIFVNGDENQDFVNEGDIL